MYQYLIYELVGTKFVNQFLLVNESGLNGFAMSDFVSEDGAF